MLYTQSKRQSLSQRVMLQTDDEWKGKHVQRGELTCLRSHNRVVGKPGKESRSPESPCRAIALNHIPIFVKQRWSQTDVSWCSHISPLTAKCWLRVWGNARDGCPLCHHPVPKTQRDFPALENTDTNKISFAFSPSLL